MTTTRTTPAGTVDTRPAPLLRLHDLARRLSADTRARLDATTFAPPEATWGELIDQRKADGICTTLATAAKELVKYSAPAARRYVARGTRNLIDAIRRLGEWRPAYHEVTVMLAPAVARAAIDGISRSQGAAGIDFGAAEAPPAEPALEEGETVIEAPVDVFELLAAPRGAPDDLAKLPGVGPQIVKKLNDGGVFHYWQIAAMNSEEAEKLDTDLKLGGRIARDHWVEQARALASV